MIRDSDLDVSGIQPEARRIVGQAAAVFVSVLGGRLVSLVAHGSAVKGGFIPGCSDVDFVLIVRPGALNDGLNESGQLPFGEVTAIQRGLSRIDISPFRYLQSRVEEAGVPRKGGFVQGAHSVVWGERDVPLATAEDLTESARERFRELDVDTMEARICNRLLDCGEGRFDREVRYICTDVWPVLFNLLALESRDPLSVWKMTKQEAIAATDSGTEVGRSVRAFYDAVLTHYSTGESVETGIRVLECGLRFLRSARDRARRINPM